MHLKYIIFSTVVFLITVTTFGQNNTNSPYSRFGLGNLNETGYAHSIAMAGTGIAKRSVNNIDFQNPASYAWFKPNAHILQLGIRNDYNIIQNSNTKQRSGNSNLDYFSFGFPVAKWWGAGVGLLPYSTVSYEISNTEKIIGNENAQYNSLYEGSGGINRFFIGNGFRPLKNLTIGFNISYLFGTIEHQSKTLFNNDTIDYYYLNTRIENFDRYNGFIYDLGFQYKLDLKNERALVIGGIYSPNLNINKIYEQKTVTFLDGSVYDIERDDVLSIQSETENVVFPSKWGAGLAFQKINKYNFTTEIKGQNWSDYTNGNINDSLNNSMTISAGMEYIPDIVSTGYLKRIQYRLGLTYGQSYLNLQEESLTKVGMTFGVGLPLVRRIRKEDPEQLEGTTLNLGFQLGQIGTTENNLIKEQYALILLGVTFNNVWFKKRKID